MKTDNERMQRQKSRSQSLVKRMVRLGQRVFRQLVTQRAIQAHFTGLPQDENGYTPWFCEAAICWIQSRDWRYTRVFEWGAGASTLFWRQVSTHTITVEDNEKWHIRIGHLVLKHCPLGFGEIKLAQSEKDYILALSRTSYHPKVFVIDGSYRNACLQEVFKYIEANALDAAVIIFDNSDWFPASHDILLNHPRLTFCTDFVGPTPLVPFDTRTTIACIGNLDNIAPPRRMAGGRFVPKNFETHLQ